MNDLVQRWKTANGLLISEKLIKALRNDDPFEQFLFEQTGTSDGSKLADLRGIEIVDVDFESVELTYIDFSFALFRNCTFNKANFFASKLDHASFEGCKIYHCIMSELRGTDTLFSNCFLESDDFTSSAFQNITISNSALKSVGFSSSRLYKPIFSSVNVNNVDFSWSRIVPTDSLVKLFEKKSEELTLKGVSWFDSNGDPADSPIGRGWLKKLLSRRDERT